MQYLEEGSIDLVCLSTDLDMEHCDGTREIANAIRGIYYIASRHGIVTTNVIRQIFNEDKNLLQQIHEDKRQKDKC